ncbi:diaminopimelate decarboxylase-like isoform X2 [Oppia nitens]|uniref:diaminopimelate decarboxylase-like isoform X2 n=1 Tax=Oppia nitens TaxID=1686743 RepID=UPI0023DC5CCB|nr:diaminopimelate decarboxylase-like isoform X2 [Oppia nitens]
MSENEDKSKEKETGFIGSIRRLSRRFSGTLLNVDSKAGPHMVHSGRKTIYSYDDEEQLRIGGVSAEELIEKYGTPLYVYDVNRLTDNYNVYLGSLKSIKNFMLCYAVKANPNLALIDIFARLGCGFDVVSGGELSRCLSVGVDPSKIVYSGCGKSIEEIDYAVRSEIHCINVESWLELERIEDRARTHNKTQNVSIRINPDVNLEGSSHHKFGVPIHEAPEIFNRAKASAHLKVKGISCHLGSGIHQLEPFIEARDKLLSLADELRQENRIWIEHINLGGGFAAQIATNLNVPDIPGWVEKLAKPITDRGLKLVLEPGRSLMADAGLLLTKIEYVKRFGSCGSGTSSPRSGSLAGPPTTPTSKTPIAPKAFVIVDTGFNDFARTALYGQQHKLIPTNAKVDNLPGLPMDYKYDIVGPICESTDIFFKDLILSQKLEPNSALAICDVGAYGMSMSSNYNSRNRPAEVLISDGPTHTLIRERESYEEQYAKERIATDINLRALEMLEEFASREDLAQNDEQNGSQ